METKISVSAEARPDNQDAQQPSKFELRIFADVEGDVNLSELSDVEIYDLIYPLAIEQVEAAIQRIADHTASRLGRVIPHERPVIDLKGGAAFTTDGTGKFQQRHEISGHIAVDTNGVADIGESWLIGKPDLTMAAAQNIVTNVLRGLGREDVSIDPALVNGRVGTSIRTAERQSRH